jgi:PAS domain S-box-containing protein
MAALPIGGRKGVLARVELEPILAAVIRSSLDCIIVIDEAGRVLEFNPASEQTFGYSRSEALGRPIAELIVPEHLREAHERGLARYTGGAPAKLVGNRTETEGLRKSGETFPIELTIMEVHAPGRRVFTASLRDLSGLKAGQSELEEARRHLELATEGAKLGAWKLDMSDGSSWFSPRSREIYGLTCDVQIDIGLFRKLLHPDDWEEASRPYFAGFPEDVLEAEYRIIRPDGDMRWIYALGAAQRDADGVARSIYGVHLDITDRKHNEHVLARSQEALHQSEKLAAMGSLLAGVSHELNNPLAAIVGQAEMLQEDCRGTPMEERAKRISGAAERCARIVQTFLAMARQQEPRRNLLDLNDVVAAALELVEYGLRTASVSVGVDYGTRLPPVTGDRDQLHQVLVNLIVNAQQAMEDCQPSGKTLTIKTSIDQRGHVLIDICDTGPGIADQHRGRIFDPFFTTKAIGTGTGVGLSFSQGIIEAHGGTVTLEPSQRGAHFRIALPPAAAPVVTPQMIVEPLETSSSQQASEKRRILVVEDEVDVGETLRELLQREGYEVSLVCDGGAALIELDRGEFDIVLSDLRMPGVSGSDLYSRLAESSPEKLANLAFITGDTLGSAMSEFLRSSGRPVLEKPFTRTSVRGLLAALEGSRVT